MEHHEQPTKNVKIASKFILQEEFAIIESRIPHDSATDRELYNQLINDKKTNSRQKLKVFRRLLEIQPSPMPHDERKKRFAEQYLVDLLIKEYMYGNVENKPALMNTFKKAHHLIHLQKLTRNLHQLQTYQQARNILEMLEFIVKTQMEKEEKEKEGKEGEINKEKETNNAKDRVEFQKTEYKAYIKLVQIIKEEFMAGSQVIKDDQFKLKWLEYFVDVLRSLNLVVRVFHNTELGFQFLCDHIRILLSKSNILTKEVLTQLYLLLVFLNRQQPPPDSKLLLIHYLHAVNVVNSVNNLSSYLQLLPTLKQTEHKCQLIPLLLKSFQMYYPTYQDKQNVFDLIIPLFQVGRTVYSYLEEIITVIVKDNPVNWSLEGNYLKKFFISTVVMKHFGTKPVLVQWPSIIQDVISQAGCMTVPYAHQCSQILFSKLFQQCNNDYIPWSNTWIKQYKHCLLSTSGSDIRGIIQFINPIILSIHPSPLLLKDIIGIKLGGNSNGDLGVISLIKCFKDLGKIIVDNEGKRFICAKDKTIFFTEGEIQQFVISCDPMISLKALQFLTCSLKASFVEPVEYGLILTFYNNSLKTSSPQYRKSYLNATKKFFQRLRVVYQNELTKSETTLATNKKYKPKPYFNQFKVFLQSLIDVCFQSVFPDAIFEIVNPALQILQLITVYFGRRKNEYKKGQILQPSHILTQLHFFNQVRFQNLLICLQSSYQSVRLTAHDILRLFDDFQNTNLLLKLWDQSLVNANKLTIRSYEFACRTLSFISQTYPTILNLPHKYTLIELNVLQFFLSTLRTRYVIFKEQFATQQQTYYKNLIHGILTCFSYIFDDLSNSIRSNPEHYADHHSEIKAFTREFFSQMCLIITFSVEICSSSISTIVLDTLPQSQTDKKYKVDCRGHFLQSAENKSSIGDFLDSTALLGSMKNEQEGIQNNLVVSFYLLTREAGLVFQSIGNLVSTPTSPSFIPSQSLIQLVNTYFYALINLKHMGSVDRISTGLGKMAKVIFDNSDKSLSQLPQILLNKLLYNLTQGNFTNILRRSAGVPYAFCCLLKSDALKRKHLIEKTIKSLLSLSEGREDKIELAIHSLNILKKLFQDSDLKYELDPYVSQAFISSIKGFTSEEWGIRNSSLMLFSVLANRTVGLKPSYNLIQFFHKCPELFQFMQTQLQQRIQSMYPPLYPIVLLLSRLLPFDLKEKARISIKGEGVSMNNGGSITNFKQLRKQQLLTLLPLIQKAGKNNNFMGRVMTAKAILPFMEINKIIPHCLLLLKSALTSRLTDNNLLHYYLSQALQLLLSFNQIYNSLKQQQNPIDKPTLSGILQFLHCSSQKIPSLKCPIILETLIKIQHFLFTNYWTQLGKLPQFQSVKQQCKHTCETIINELVYKCKGFVINLNTGHSILRNQVLELYIRLLSPGQQLQTYLHFTSTLTHELNSNPDFFKTADNEVIVFYLGKINAFYKENTREQPQPQPQPQTQPQPQLLRFVQSISLPKIQSDEVLIGVISLRTILTMQYSQTQLHWLIQQISTSNNFYLKIAIFKYMQRVDIRGEKLREFAIAFSNPQELIQLRECSVQFIEEYNKVEADHYIMYIRLLEDEEYQIRRETARVLGKAMGVSHNEQCIKKSILNALTLPQFQLFLSLASDYQVKRKNHEEERIFSYDKPNKYRSDISNLMHLLIHNPTLRANPERIAETFKKSSTVTVNPAQARSLFQEYSASPMDRNEYQFQTILRMFFILKYSENDVPQQLIERVMCSQLQLKQIYQAYK